MQLDISGLESYKAEIAESSSLDALYQVKVKYLGKNGLISNLNRQLKDIPNDQKKEAGMKIGSLRADFETLHDAKELELKNAEKNAKLTGESLDITLPGLPFAAGSIHPVTKVFDEIVDIFSAMGFEVAIGPEVEHDFYNFEALNIPKEHPARDMQDTFYITDEILMRTHTSPVQVRTMLKNKPPVKIIAPGKVYRCDSDITHTPMFHQVEGLLVDEEGKVSFANLKFILEDFLKYMFGDVEVRFRPSFFPFTEPSAEVDISCVFCKGHGCRVCSKTGWLEVLGCGIVDPNVFKAVKYKNVSGYAFGLGVERFAMLIHQIGDLRSLFEGDIKLLEQFQ